jgi:broad specificity phosphatase PhoE
MTRLFLVRHGNTIDEESKKIYKGRLDVPLSRAGLERMERAGAFLASFKIDRVYTSTLSRSTDSGHAVARALGLDIEIEPAFDEVDFGLWEGLSFLEIRERYPRELDLWIQNPGTHPPPQGESFRHARKRSMERLRQIVDGSRDNTIAIVAHAGILRIMIFSLLGLRLTRLFRLGQDYGCINIVDVHDDGVASLNLLNFTYY